jgi:hypothetical protein
MRIANALVSFLGVSSLLVTGRSKRQAEIQAASVTSREGQGVP